MARGLTLASSQCGLILRKWRLCAGAWIWPSAANDMKAEIEESPEVEPTPRDWRSFWALVAMQVQNAFNDNMAKFILLPLGAWLVINGQAFKGIEHVLSVLLVLPFILFGPTSGWIADRFPKSSVIRAAAWMQLGVLGLMAAALFYQNLAMAMVAFFLLALQSTLLSPAKMGVVKELLGARKLAFASGMMEGTVILAILAGMIFGGVWFDKRLGGTGTGWTAALVPVMCLWAGGLIAIALAYRIQPTRAMSTERYTAWIAVRHFKDLRDVWRQAKLRQMVLGVAFFWGFAGFMSLVVVQIAKEMSNGGGEGMGTHNSALMAAASVGIALGSILAGRLSRRGIELGLAPLGAMVMTAAVFSLALAPPGSWAQYSMLLLAGAGGAIFLVPLNACVMDWPAEAERGKVLAVSNLMNNSFGVAAVVMQFAMGAMGMGTRWQFLVFGVLTLGVTAHVVRRLPVSMVRLVGLALVNRFYHIRALGAERMPERGGVLLAPNHISFMDAFFLYAASPRPVRFLIDQRFYERWWARWMVRLFNSVPISPDSTRTAIGQVAAALAEGHVVCVFPEGRLTRTGFMCELKRGYELMAKKGGALILPAYMDGVWGSIFSFERGRFIRKRPYRIPYRITVAFGSVLQPAEAGVERLRTELLLGSAHTLASRSDDAAQVQRRVFDGSELEILRALDEAQRVRLCLHLLQLANVAAWRRRETLWLCPHAGPALQLLVHAFARGFGGRVELGVPGPGEGRRDVIGGAAMRERLRGAGAVVFFDFDASGGREDFLGAEGVHCPCLMISGVVVAVSTPEPPAAEHDVAAQPGGRRGSAGRLLPGFTVTTGEAGKSIGGPSVVEPIELGESVEIDAEGFIFLRQAGASDGVALAKAAGS